MIVASFNLDSLDDTEVDPRDFSARAAALRPKLQALDADVLCLQEIQGQKTGPERSLRALERLLEGTAYAGYHLIHSVMDSGRLSDVHNLAILSKRPMVRSGQIRHELVPPLSDAELPSGATRSQIEWDRPFLYMAIPCLDGRRLWVLNLHLRAPIAAHVQEGRAEGAWRSIPLWAEGFVRANLKRIGQALEVRLFIDRIFDEEQKDALICACGDFNSEGAEMPLRLIRADSDDTEAPDLAWRRMLPLDRGGPSAIHLGRPMRPDHLLASPALAARHRRSELMNQNLPDDTDAGVADSPHAPILAEFDLN